MVEVEVTCFGQHDIFQSWRSEEVNCFVLDEADRMLDMGFQEGRARQRLVRQIGGASLGYGWRELQKP